MQKMIMAVIVLGLFMMGGMFILSLNQQNNRQVVTQPAESNINIQIDRTVPQAPIVVAPVAPRPPRWNFGVWWGRPVAPHIDINVNRNVHKDVDKTK